MFYNEELTVYLNNIQQRLMEEKIELDKAYADICNHILENEKFVSLLDESNDPNYESFTPRDVNAKNKEKINILMQEKKELENEGTSVRAKIDDIIFEQDKLKQIIQKNREASFQNMDNQTVQDSLITIMSRLNRYHTKTKIEQENYLKEKINALIHRVELCTHIFSIDKMRCKMELDNIKDELLKIEKSIHPDIQNQRNDFSSYLSELNQKMEEQYPYIHIQIGIKDSQVNEKIESSMDDDRLSLLQSVISSYFYEKLRQYREQQIECTYVIEIEMVDTKVRITIKSNENIDFSMIL